jgi:nitroreductase
MLMGELLTALTERRAKRSFAARPVSEAEQELLWRSVSVAPSHGNSQPVRLAVARSGEAREAVIKALSEGNRVWAPAAPLLLAVVAVPDQEPGQIDERARELLGLNSGIALGNLLTQATHMGLIAHPLAGYSDAGVREAFGLPDEVRVMALLAIGYPGDAQELPEDLKKRETAEQQRLPLEHVVVYDRWTPTQSVRARDLRK